MSDLVQKISKEDKTTMLIGDFNIDLLKYDTNADRTAFLDSMYANFFLPYITTPTRVTTHSKTLIDNIFLNNIEDGLKVVSATFLLVCVLSLNESTCQTRKNVFYFTSKALFILKKIKF